MVEPDLRLLLPLHHLPPQQHLFLRLHLHDGGLGLREVHRRLQAVTLPGCDGQVHCPAQNFKVNMYPGFWVQVLKVLMATS